MPENSPDVVASEGDVEEKKPTLAESFEKISKVVEKYDEEQVKGWKEDIDTLLVFAGLFSAVVTAFLIEAYQKLEEDPADKTVALLEKLVSLQQPNISQTAAISSDLNPFTPDASTIRINCFWLLSLIFSLTSALFGLLCKQWLREYQREPPTSSPAEALALRQLRRDSFEKWGVPGFLSALPILLEIALLFFFAGILDLLWGLHHIPFVVSTVAVTVSAGLYFITTLLPTLSVPKRLDRKIQSQRFQLLSYQFICPYRSPQAWAVYCLATSRNIWISLLVYVFAPWLKIRARWPCSDWASFDLQVLRQYDEHVQSRSNNLFSLQVYQLRAFEWIAMMFSDSPLIIPHLQNVLGTIPPSVAMSAVLGHWNVALWTDISREDVNLAVGNPTEFYRRYSWYRFLGGLSRFPPVPHPVLCQPDGIKFLFVHQLLMTRAVHSGFYAALEQMGLRTADSHFVAPLSVIGRRWVHQDASVRKRSLVLLRLYEQSWKSCSSSEDDRFHRHRYERLAFILVLAKHINRTDRTSVLITSKRGQEFIRFIHNEILIQQLYRYFERTDYSELWLQAIKKTQEVGNLPVDYFVPLPRLRDPRPTLSPLPPIRYSLETQPDVEVDHDDQVRGSRRDGETSDDENLLEIQTVGNPAIMDDNNGNSGSSSVSGIGHTASPGLGRPFAHSDDEPGSVSCTNDTQYQPSEEIDSLVVTPSPGPTFNVHGDKQILGSAHAWDQDRDPQPSGKVNADLENLVAARVRKLDDPHVAYAGPAHDPASVPDSDQELPSAHSIDEQTLSSLPRATSICGQDHDANPASTFLGATKADASSSSHTNEVGGDEHPVARTRC
ncbi:hypothetical protein VNI00_008017 [Paramarasmius palmivorus]|uniref:DUF6535 domain-containing protein n=1 Tax=Paramarasmius palmivorus TaxID=297713 RepID=A0AAW0CXB2_9AGAR